jgi:hypothetical protein
MPDCRFCGTAVEIRGRALVKDLCPSCRRDLHCCRQCRFHHPPSHNQCREPKAEMVRDREKRNYCDYFEFGAPPETDRSRERTQARKALDDLFKKK